MYAVIFRATLSTMDKPYTVMAERLRQLAIDSSGCIDFVSFTEGEREITISYWESEDDIKRWKQNSEHLIAQQLGRERWYQDYSVQVSEIKREYKK